MKIIKEGVVPTFKGTCFFCGCEIECDKTEGGITYNDVPILTLCCPTAGCGNTIRAYPIVPPIKRKSKYYKE